MAVVVAKNTSAFYLYALHVSPEHNSNQKANPCFFSHSLVSAPKQPLAVWPGTQEHGGGSVSWLRVWESPNMGSSLPGPSSLVRSVAIPFLLFPGWEIKLLLCLF